MKNKAIKKLMPDSLFRALSKSKGRGSLRLIQRLRCDSAPLLSVGDVDLKNTFSCGRTESRWLDSKIRLEEFKIPDSTGGVNRGDRQAVYYLINEFSPSSVLEVGTHIGASTLHLAEALFAKQEGSPAHLVSVDITDVNDPVSKPWLQYGARHSPLEMVNQMGFGKFVEFVTASSLDYFARSKQKFDFIFLDGDHASTAVYREIPPALELLNPGGLILLHDYFPDLKPLWSNGKVIPGPFLAAERFRKEGANLVVLPFGELPWTTKLQSNVSSLALLLRNH